MQRPQKLIAVGIAFLLTANVAASLGIVGFDLVALASGGLGLGFVLTGAAAK